MLKKIFYRLLLLLFLSSLAFPIFSEGERIQKRIKNFVKSITSELIDIRRDIHAHPELAFQERRTSRIVADYLEKLGAEVKIGIAETGVLGILKGEKPGPVVAMRADMDALFIEEKTDLPFASKEKDVIDRKEYGLMHACGHDVHTTILLGIARVLSELNEELPGTVLFIAQPAEERGGGARRMLEEGLFEEIKPEAVFGYHVNGSINAGFISYIPGIATANCDGFRLVIKSEGCHGSDPSRCVDPIVVGAQIVVALQVMISREIDVHKDCVITVGSFHGGTASNIIPQKVELKATVRSHGEGLSEIIQQKIERIIQNICEAGGAQFELNYYRGSGSVYNDPGLLNEILPTVGKVLGGNDFLQEDPPSMGGEDFCLYSRLVPSVMLYLGVLPRNMEKTSVHSPHFIVDEESIPVGIEVMSSVIFDYLERHSAKR